MKVTLSLVFLFVFYTNIYAQKEKKKMIDIYNISEKGDFYSYGSGKVLKSIDVKKVKKDQSSVENLLVMQISSDSVSFSDKLYKDNKSRADQKNLDIKQKMPRDSVFFLLENKLELTINKTSVCIVKGKLKKQGFPLQPTVLSFEKINGKWYFGNEGKALEFYHTLFFTMSSNTLNEILIDKKSPNKYLNDIILQSIENNVVNLDLFYKILIPKSDSREPEIKEFMEPSLIKK